MELEEILEVMSKKNVTLSMVGTKKVNGVDTKEPCVVVCVSQKMNEQDLSDEELIPKVLKSGAKTDVVVHPKISAMNGCNDVPSVKWRPLRGGISAIRIGQTACTLGAIVKDSLDKKLVALTNNHCAGVVYDPNYLIPQGGNLNTVGDKNLQPSPIDGGNVQDEYGVVKRVVPIKFGGEPNYVDASISTIDELNPLHDILNVSTEPLEFELDKNSYVEAITVLKNGRTTCYTSAVKANYFVNVNVDYADPATNADTALFINQIYIVGSSEFSQGGDSGSVVVAEINGQNKIIGLLFAGGVDENNNFVTIANHISDVASSLNIESWNGDIVVPYNQAPTITINGKMYSRVEDTTDPITHYL